MDKRPEVKSVEEYIKELSRVAPAEKVDEFKRLYEGGKRIHAVQILREYKIFSS